MTQQGEAPNKETYKFSSNLNYSVTGIATIEVTSTNPSTNQTIFVPHNTISGMATTFANNLSLSGYVVTSVHNYPINRRDITIEAISPGDLADLTLSWTESGTTGVLGGPDTILDPTTFTKVQDGSNGQLEIATITLTGTTESGIITVTIDSQSFNVPITGGDSAIVVANKVFAVIGANGVVGYTAINNGDGSITLTSNTPANLDDLNVVVTN